MIEQVSQRYHSLSFASNSSPYSDSPAAQRSSRPELALLVGGDLVEVDEPHRLVSAVTPVGDSVLAQQVFPRDDAEHAGVVAIETHNLQRVSLVWAMRTSRVGDIAAGLHRVDQDVAARLAKDGRPGLVGSYGDRLTVGGSC